MDIELGLMTGVDLLLEPLQLIIHQPTIKEISMIGEKEFFSAIQFICIDKENQLNLEKEILEQISNFQIFIRIMGEKQTASLKQNIMRCLDLLFPNYKIIIIPERSLVFNSEGTNAIIDEQNFEILQSTLKRMFKLEGKEDEGFNPANAKAAEIAKKLMRGRERVAKEKARKGEGTNSIKQYLSILPLAYPSISIEAACNLTIYQLYTLIERYTLYVEWDLDIRTRLAGGSPNKSPDNWMKNI